MWRLRSSRRKHHESSPRRQARTGCRAPFGCRKRDRNLARSHQRSRCQAIFLSTVYPTDREATLHAFESVPHGRARRRARAGSVRGRAVHQVVAGGLSEARQAALRSGSLAELEPNR